MGIATIMPSGMLWMATAAAMEMPVWGFSIALTKVAMPSGKLCMAMAITEKSPSRISLELSASGRHPSGVGAAEYS